MSDLDPVVIGRFGRPFGVLGWIKVISFIDPKDGILDLGDWLIKDQQGGTWRNLSLDSSKRNGTNILAKVSGYTTREEVASLTNSEIGVLRRHLPKLDRGEYYWSDLIGLKVVNQVGVDFGVVSDLIATGANDVLVVKGDRRRLIPYVSSVILKVDLHDKTILVDWEHDYL